MRSVLISNMRRVKRAVPVIENKVKVQIGFGRSSAHPKLRNRGARVGIITVKGNELNEFLVEKVLHAVDFGFDIDDALLLLNEDFVLEFIEVKEHTRRKNLKDVRSRIIGREGRARQTIEKLTGAAIVISGNDVGVIVDADHLAMTIQGIESLISGSKHGNVFGFLERQGAKINKMDEDLGLREGIGDRY